jgi:hypothetical protein
MREPDRQDCLSSTTLAAQVIPSHRRPSRSSLRITTDRGETADHLPFSEVVETYQAELLAFRRNVPD